MSSILKCQCCGFEQEFAGDDAAHEAGWDDPTHFPSWPVSCNLCPGVASLGLVDHSLAHKAWEMDGRPQHFSTFGLPPAEPVTDDLVNLMERFVGEGE